MDQDQTKLKKAANVALAALGLLLAGALLFYKERILFTDSAFKTFRIIETGFFSIEEYRVGSFVSQLIPYLGQKLHLPVEILLIGYSIGFNLFYLLAAAILVYRYKQYMLAIIMALYYFLFVSDSFFWANDEIHQAVAWMFLLFGVTIALGKREIKLWVLLPPFILLSFLAVFTHFVVVIPMLFLWIYLWIEKKHWPFPKNTSILLSGILVAMVFLKYKLSAAATYDGPHLQRLSAFSFNDVMGTFTTPVIRIFLYRCVVNYWIAIIVFVTGIVSLLVGRKYLLAAWTFFVCIGYFILIGLIYGSAGGNQLLFYIETEWACLGIIFATPFVFHFLPRLKPMVAVWFLVAIFMVRVVYICNAIPAFTWRTHFREQVLSQMRRKGITKLELVSTPELKSEYMQDWALPEESILSSAMYGDNPQLTFLFIDSNNNPMKGIMAIPQCINLGLELSRPCYLDNRYFTLDSTHPYQILTYEQLLK